MRKENEHIRQLLDKYIHGQHTPEELDELLHYSVQADGEQTIGELVEQYLAERQSADAVQVDRLGKILNRTDRKLREAVPLPSTEGETQRRLDRRWLAVAAVLLAVLSFSFYLFFYNAPVQTIRITAMGTEAQQVELPDGSQVWVNAGATLSYPERFGKDSREITLSDGQAFFTVTKDEERPFRVDAGKLRVEVLGTSFEVTAFQNLEQASVAVQSGKVSVSAGGTARDSESTTLTANQKGTINTQTGQVITTDIDSEAIAGWKQHKLIFSDDGFATVIEALQRRYGVSIDLRKAALRNEKITLTLDDQPLRTVLEILSVSSNFSYQFANDSTVVIQ